MRSVSVPPYGPEVVMLEHPVLKARKLDVLGRAIPLNRSSPASIELLTNSEGMKKNRLWENIAAAGS